MLKRLWFWLVIAGLALTIIPACVSSTRNIVSLAARFGFAGYTLEMAAGVRFRDPRAGLLNVMLTGAVFGWLEVYAFSGKPRVTRSL